MQTIKTKYLGPTNFRGSRIKAETESGFSLTVGCADNLSVEENQDRAALALAAKMQWEGDFIRGSTKEGYVYVFAKDKKIVNPFKRKDAKPVPFRLHGEDRLVSITERPSRSEF